MIKELFYTKDEAIQRQNYLQVALSMSSGTGYLSTSQRIGINQERGALLATIRELEHSDETTVRFTRSISAPLEAIVKRIHTDLN